MVCGPCLYHSNVCYGGARRPQSPRKEPSVISHPSYIRSCGSPFVAGVVAKRRVTRSMRTLAAGDSHGSLPSESDTYLVLGRIPCEGQLLMGDEDRRHIYLGKCIYWYQN